MKENSSSNNKVKEKWNKKLNDNGDDGNAINGRVETSKNDANQN